MLKTQNEKLEELKQIRQLLESKQEPPPTPPTKGLSTNTNFILVKMSMRWGIE